MRGADTGRPALDGAIIAESTAEPARFATIFDRHFTAIHAYLARRVGSTVADDLAAEVFVVAFERRERFERTAADARPWLYGIATNVLRGHRRAERRRLAALARLGTDGGTEERTDEVVERSRLAAALAVVPDEQRDALLLHVWGGLTHAEVAASLGIPVGTAASRIARSRAHLRAALGDDVDLADRGGSVPAGKEHHDG